MQSKGTINLHIDKERAFICKLKKEEYPKTNKVEAYLVDDVANQGVDS
jgi:hypothetical protein